MGYKLAGYRVAGCVDVDPRMIELYKANLHPPLAYLTDIRDFVKRDDLPDNLYKLDVLDGSPPCTVFSTAGKREKDWGKSRDYAEGAVRQTLDDLFFHYLDLVGKLRPKVFIAENVTGLVMGNAKGYVNEIIKKAHSIGYSVQLFKLNAAMMGVPQMRERVFFVGNRCGFGKLTLDFHEPVITFGDIRSEHGLPRELPNSVQDLLNNYWKPGELFLKKAYCRKMRDWSKNAYFSTAVLYDNRPVNTQTSTTQHTAWFIRACDKKWMSNHDMVSAQTFPQDYDFGSDKPEIVKYVTGMSVPPVMLAQIASAVKEQWLNV